MPSPGPLELDLKSPPFDQLTGVQRLSTDRGGRESVASGRHHLYVGRDKRTRGQVLVKLPSHPGLVYQQNLSNEIQSLETINRELPDSRHFPLLLDHGTLGDGRVFLVMPLFDELPLATIIDSERAPTRLVAHIRTALEIAAALMELHRLPIFHVDLNPMNILSRIEQGRPVIRIVDFESSYDASRHGSGAFYSPSTTTGYSAPEVTGRPPDARSDLFSLGAVLYTLLAGYTWTWSHDAGTSIERDADLDAELKAILSRAVAADPDRRDPSVGVFRAALADYLERIWPGRSW